ncbi:probable cytochrome P450 6a23 [Teleopsis dalmanni]|uniref:probable cytochrome P450 6a23 n=1 Tax=Teleopsis dalmanni TaxID=139649 RepID=UPI0018CE83A0|nr:probable cytochrome P450 6a23 [Teleopsis dalmanni]
MDILYFLLYFIISSSLIIYLSLRKIYSYWAERGILHDKPKFFSGNFHEFGKTKSAYEILREYYEKYKGKAKFVGIYFLLRRSVFVIDFELMKTLLIKDFDYFTGRGTYYNEKDDPLSANLVFVEGEKWRKSRAELNPCFTLGKLKFMFPAAMDVANQLVQVIKEQQLSTSNQDIEIESLINRYIIDLVGSIGFGLNCNSLKNPNAEFKKMVERSFKLRYHFVMYSFMYVFPNLSRKLGIKYYTADVQKFFLRIVNETVKYREETGDQRNDFMNLLIELRNSHKTESLSIQDITTHAFTLLTAGVETNTAAMSFCLYELALNQDVQDKARTEINEVLTRYDGKLNYEGMNELKYLQQVFFENLRKHPVFPFDIRVCTKDYVVPDSKHIIEKNTSVIIPTAAIHYDPEIYPNPEQFDPERFSVDEVKKRHPMAFLGFGDGPRVCIGKKFAIMQIVVGLVMILQNYRILPTSKTPIPMKYKTNKLFAEAKDEIYLKLEEI